MKNIQIIFLNGIDKKTFFCIIQDLIAAVGRARIEEQKQSALANIQKNKNATLKKLDIQYVNWDKAKKSIGYVGITFLACLFGSIFANDFIKVCIYYIKYMRGRWVRWWHRKNEEKRELTEENKDEIILEMEQAYSDDLEESLEKVYIKLLEANAKNNRK